MAYGLKASKSGVDVLSAANNELSYSSDFNTMKVAKIIHFNASGSDQTQAHGLGYVPVMWYLIESGSFWRIGPLGILYGFPSMVSVDATNVYYHYSTEGYVVLFVNKMNE
jgi:hypothetical protein